MDESKVSSFDDMMAAADARLNAPIEPITKPATSVTRQATPAPEDSPADDQDPADGDPGDEHQEPPETEQEVEASFEVDGEKLTPAQIRQMKRDAQRVQQADEAQRTAQYLLQHPEEYERVRREHGLAPAAKPEPEKSAAPTGPDPIDDANGWKYARFNQYVDYLAQRGQTATPQDIQAQVEVDHEKARTNRLHEILLEERKERKLQDQERERQQAQWRQDQEAAGIARTLTPLFQKYPEAATPDGQEEVEARIIRAVHLGQPVDYEAIVKTVHQRNGGVIRNYVAKKQAMAGGAGPAVARGGSAQAGRAKLQDTLPADFSSLSRYAEMKERGEA